MRNIFQTRRGVGFASIFIIIHGNNTNCFTSGLLAAVVHQREIVQLADGVTALAQLYALYSHRARSFNQ